MSSTESQNPSYRLIHCKSAPAVLSQYYGIGKWRRNKICNLPFKGVNASSKTKEYAALFYVQTADL